MRKVFVFILVAMLVTLGVFANAESYTPEWLAETYNAASVDGFTIIAEYHPSMDVFTYVIQSTDITTSMWTACETAVRTQYMDTFSSLVSSVKDSLDLMGNTSTTVVSTFQLCDGNATFLMIDRNDFSSMISN